MEFNAEINYPEVDSFLYETTLFVEDLNNIMLECMYEEHYYIKNVLEADMMGGKHGTNMVKQKAGEKMVPKFIQAIKKFFRKATDMFLNFINKYGRKHARFLANVEKNIDKVNFANLTISMDKTYLDAQDNLKKIRDTSLFRNLTDRNILSKGEIKNAMDSKNEITMDSFLQSSFCREYLSAEGSLSEGSKNYFRYGDPKHKQLLKNIRGQQIKEICKYCLEYCKSYSDVKNELSAVQKSAENMLNNISEKLSSTQESLSNIYLFIEDSPLLESSLSVVSDLDLLLEAENTNNANNNGQQKAQNNEQQKEAQKEEAKDNKPKVEEDPNDKQQEEDDKNNNETIEKNAGNKNALKILQFVSQALQVYVSAALTVAEERYLTYIRILSYCVKRSNYNGSYKDNKQTDMQTDEPVTKEARKKEEKAKKKSILRRIKRE